MKYRPTLAVLIAGSLLSACGGADDGSPTSEENAQLNQISEELDTSADSLVAEDPALGNGETAETGDLLVADQNVAAGNGQ